MEKLPAARNVYTITLAPQCINTMPCSHKATILLMNGNSYSVTLYADHICDYLEANPKIKVALDQKMSWVAPVRWIEEHIRPNVFKKI